MYRITATIGVAAMICTALSAQQPDSQAIPSKPLPVAQAHTSSIIQGSAVSSTNKALSGAPVRLRDARLGSIVQTQTTDNGGFFTFRPVDPGSYIAELTASDQTVLAASEIINVGSNDRRSVLLKLPNRIAPAAAAGHSGGQALVITAVAAASGVLGAALVGSQSTCSNGACGSSGR